MASKSALWQAEAGLPASSPRIVTTSKWASRGILLTLSFFGAILFCKRWITSAGIHEVIRPVPIAECPEQVVFQPSLREDITRTNIDQLFRSEEFKNLAASRLSGAVQVPTVTYDGMGELETDPRWDIFYDFGSYLKSTFPELHKNLKVDTVNKHSYLYTWQGSDSSLKPILLMAHCDVVPVDNDTISHWTYPPFAGHYDGQYIWGRGSEDDKSNLIAILSALDALFTLDFKPSRTILFSIGFDEEGGASKKYGAKALAERLLETYGENGIELILDEGTASIKNYFGTDFALPGTAEKGMITVSVTVDTAGGHSSLPPDHTAIGFLSKIVQAIEDNPFQSTISAKNPTAAYLSCAASYASDISYDLKDAILNSHSTDAVIHYLDSSPATRGLVRTTTAVDIVRGGVKVNALPETAYIQVNHRVSVDQSIQSVKEHYDQLIFPFTRQWNFTYHGFDKDLASQSEQDTSTLGAISVATVHEGGPSPISKPSDSQFSWLIGTLRGVFGEDLVVAPILFTANTDTRYFWNLSPQIYRMSPWHASLDPRGSRKHGLDERFPVEGLLELINFFHEFIRVVDEKRISK